VDHYLQTRPIRRSLDTRAARRSQREVVTAPASAARATREFFGSVIQPKLAIGELNHPLENEADRLADSIVRMPDPDRAGDGGGDGGNRSCATCGDPHRDSDSVRRKAVENSEGTTAACDRCAKPSARVVIRPADSAGGLESAIGALEGSGEPLPSAARRCMERRFARDFARVRVHTDGRAADIAREVGARAFTYGRNVVFAPGEYAPDSSTHSRRLLAHELAHVIQQGESRSRPAESAIRQGVEGAVNIPEETAEYAHKRGGVAYSMLQRSAKWKGAVVHETINPATMPFDRPRSPITWQMLNGAKLRTEVDAQNSIKTPRVQESADLPELIPESISHRPKRPAAIPVSTEPPEPIEAARGERKRERQDPESVTFTARIDSVPAQEGSADETVLRPGPWSTTVSKDRLRQEVDGFDAIDACGGPGMTNFSEHGHPSDAAVYKANRRHEDHHVADDKAAFEETVERWDQKVQEAKDKRAVFRGKTREEATTALWDAMGHSPGGVARAYLALCLARGGAFHDTPAGKRMHTDPDTARANKDCSVSSIDVTNPA
jgi:uncharacterized protein DUF4157